MDRGGARIRPGALLERGSELEEIDELLAATVSGEGRALLIEGPAGIGKTALLEAARGRAREHQITVISGRGGELEGHFPFGVVRQLLEPVLHRASSRRRNELLTGAARLAAPVLTGAEESVTAGDTGYGQLHGLYWLTVNISAVGPVLILVDDLHWADARSLRYLLYLIGRLEGVPIGVVGTIRSGERPVEPALIAELESGQRVDAIVPSALSDVATAELITAGLGRAPAESFAAACTTATGGIPFLVHELVAALAADRAEPTAEHAADVEDLGPRAIARATVVRLARMPAGCLPLARAVAVLGGDAQLPRAARLAALDEAAALDALDALVRGGVVRPNDRLEFVHPILRAAIYDELAPGERSRLHRQAADLLAGEGAELDAVAAQLLACEPMGSPRVIAQLREAASHAVGRGAPEDAIAYLSRALEEGSERELRALISFELGMAARVAGRPATMAQCFREAHRLATDLRLRNRAALELATLLVFRGGVGGTSGARAGRARRSR
jgi:hypothetical protein